MGAFSSKPQQTFQLSPRRQREWQDLLDRNVITNADIKEDWNPYGVLLHFDYCIDSALSIHLQNEPNDTVVATVTPDGGNGFHQFWGSKPEETYYDMIAKIESAMLSPECQNRRTIYTS